MSNHTNTLEVTTGTTYRLAITYWNEPRDISMVDAANLDEAVASLLAGIDSGRVMSFTVEGL